MRLVAVAAAGLQLTSCTEMSHHNNETPRPSEKSTQRAQRPAVYERVRIIGGQYELEADLFLPAGEGSVPGIVWNHGSEKEPSLEHCGETARWFQTNGFAVLVPYRRGAAGSQGVHWSERVDVLAAQNVRPEEALVRALDEELDDVFIAGHWLAGHRSVHTDRVFVAGCSFGGIMAMLASERGEPFRAALDFAGASIIWDRNAEMRDRLRRAARGAKFPVFFLQAANDFNTAPSTELADQMARTGKPHRKRIFAPFGDTPRAGHAFCIRGQALWGEDVLDFLGGS